MELKQLCLSKKGVMGLAHGIIPDEYCNEVG